MINGWREPGRGKHRLWLTPVKTMAICVPSRWTHGVAPENQPPASTRPVARSTGCSPRAPIARGRTWEEPGVSLLWGPSCVGRFSGAQGDAWSQKSLIAMAPWRRSRTKRIAPPPASRLSPTPRLRLRHADKPRHLSLSVYLPGLGCVAWVGSRVASMARILADESPAFLPAASILSRLLAPPASRAPCPPKGPSWRPTSGSKTVCLDSPIVS